MNEKKGKQLKKKLWNRFDIDLIFLECLDEDVELMFLSSRQQIKSITQIRKKPGFNGQATAFASKTLNKLEMN